MGVIRILNLLYLILLVGFIYFFFNIYQPIKVHRICAEASAKEVLRLKPQDAFEYYQSLYKICSPKNF